MNKILPKEIDYKILKLLSADSKFTQREMAEEMGVSLGMVNFCISELTKKGLIKIRRFKASNNKVQYLYQLTPQGIEQKSKITLSFLKRKISEYQEIKKQIQEISRDLGKENLKNISTSEDFDLAELL